MCLRLASPFVMQPPHASILDPSSLFAPAGCRAAFASLYTASTFGCAVTSELAVLLPLPMRRHSCRRCAGVFALIAIAIVTLVTRCRAGVIALVIVVVNVRRHRCRRHIPSRRCHRHRHHRLSRRHHHCGLCHQLHIANVIVVVACCAVAIVIVDRRAVTIFANVVVRRAVAIIVDLSPVTPSPSLLTSLFVALLKSSSTSSLVASSPSLSTLSFVAPSQSWLMSSSVSPLPSSLTSLPVLARSLDCNVYGRVLGRGWASFGGSGDVLLLN